MKEYLQEFRESYRYTPSDFEKLGGIWPLRVGQNKAKSNYIVGPRVIDCYSLHFIISGSLFLSHGNEYVKLTQNDIFCLHPHIKYSYSIVEDDPDTPLRMFWMAFNGTQASPMLKYIDVSEERPYLRNRMTPELLTWVKTLFQLIAEKENNAVIRLQVTLYNIFNMLTPLTVNSPEKAHANEWLKKSVDFINTHFTEGITVAEAVRVAGVHRSHFYNEFNRLLGMSPMQYLMKLRMERASGMLKNTRLSVTEISLSCGYLDLYSFSRAFYNYYGLSPSEYRAGVPVKVNPIDVRSTTKKRNKQNVIFL
ncbi:AraC family transcriptional regulator [Paenibacillus sp. NPDC056579]|uniref:AraC family transcriptional regulator n=1 Tax=Paenibacillus sp. NPDC056579 TaxID=3345871 RepID=UPI0036AB0E57